MSSLGKKLGYVKDRAVNAYWMLREGRFKLFVSSLLQELGTRVKHIVALLKNERPLDDSEVFGSAYRDRRKVVPPSYSPTVPVPDKPAEMKADCTRLAQEAGDIVSGLDVVEEYRL